MTTNAIPPPRGDLMSAESLGQLLAATTRCHDETSALRDELREMGERLDRHSRANREMVEALGAELRQSIDDLSERQEADEHDRTRGRTLLAVGRWVTGLALGSLVSGAVWLYQGHYAQAERLATHDQQIATVRDDVERHERAPSHAGSQQRMSDLSGDLRALEATLGEVRTTVRSIDDQLRERSRRGR